MEKSQAKAHTNIALIKYWGKENASLNLPTTSSLSMTLDKFYSQTSLSLNLDSKEDQLIINGKKSDSQRVHRFLNIFRSDFKDFPSLLIESENHVATSAGLASSASAFAALTVAINQFLKLNLSERDLSRYARRGSGSASRSIFGNFVIWNKGVDDRSSYAESFWDEDIQLSMIVAEVSSLEKKISSSQGMQIAQASKGYADWVKKSESQLQEMKIGIKQSDIERVGLIAEVNALSMHELNRQCSQPFDYFVKETYELVDFAQKCYKEGMLSFVTIDAGPNVKIITDRATEQALLKKLKENFPQIKFNLAHAGPGVSFG
ncbi:MAG: diphosphomevalonate decarboxylase [Lactovum sp.]